MGIYRVYNTDHDDAGVGYSINIRGAIFFPDDYVTEWVPPLFEVRDGGFTDYQNNTLALRLCSKKLYTLFEEMMSDNDKIQWLDASVKLGGEERAYYILHFPSRPDVIDKNRSMFNRRTGSIIKPVLSAEACKEYNVFTHAYSHTSLYIRDTIKSAIEKEGLTGMEFQKERLV